MADFDRFGTRWNFFPLWTKCSWWGEPYLQVRFHLFCVLVQCESNGDVWCRVFTCFDDLMKFGHTLLENIPSDPSGLSERLSQPDCFRFKIPESEVSQKSGSTIVVNLQDDFMEQDLSGFEEVLCPLKPILVHPSTWELVYSLVPRVQEIRNDIPYYQVKCNVLVHRVSDLFNLRNHKSCLLRRWWHRDNSYGSEGYIRVVLQGVLQGEDC